MITIGRDVGLMSRMMLIETGLTIPWYQQAAHLLSLSHFHFHTFTLTLSFSHFLHMLIETKLTILSYPQAAHQAPQSDQGLGSPPFLNNSFKLLYNCHTFEIHLAYIWHEYA